MRFEPGDHLKVRRPAGYFHHGIQVNDSRVIQFGGRISDKPGATIEAVSLTDFEREGTAEIVRHGGRTWFGAPRPPADPKHRIVQRAEWLLARHPEGQYDVLGYNCEHAANFCATGLPESYQVRSFFYVRALVVGLVFPLLIRLRATSPRVLKAASILSLFNLLTVAHSWDVSRRFWERVGAEWTRYEQEHGSGG